MDDENRPGPWAKSIADIADPMDALLQIAREAEHCSFAAAALAADDSGMIFCGQQFQRLQAIARKFVPKVGKPVKERSDA